MGATTGIEWCHHTFNPWRGCTHVSPGCEHCYAETLSKRNPGQLGTWGAGGTRVIASDSMWQQPAKWEAAACKAGERRRVFCASLADVFEPLAVLSDARERLWKVIEYTPHLDWLLLTKRLENVRVLVPGRWGREGWPENVWLGVSVEDQRRADERIPLLLDTPAAVRFLSCEPLLGPVELYHGLGGCSCGLGSLPDDVGGRHHPSCTDRDERIDWVIVGGESGHGARQMDITWARSLVNQCDEARVPVFVKQLGHRPRGGGGRITDPKGGDPDEWPPDLRVRQFPPAAEVAHAA